MVLEKVFLPEGVQDLLMKDCHHRRLIEGRLMEEWVKQGYMEVSSPTLEYYDLFRQGEQMLRGNKMFKLIDAKGDLLVLRPDGTLPIARMVATKMKDMVYPLKICYIQDIFRLDQEQAGKQREFRQAGVEVFGVESYEADGQVIITAIESLKALGLSDFQIEIGQTKILQSILDSMAVTTDEKDEIIMLIHNKNFSTLESLLEKLDIDPKTRLILKEIPNLFGTPQGVMESVAALPINDNIKRALEELQQICHMIQAYGFGQYISVDLGMTAPLGYYTGIIFKGFTKDLGTILCSGGRYDRLLMSFGMNCPATGFALLIDQIRKALHLGQQKKKESGPPYYLLVSHEGRHEEVAKEATRLKKTGCIVEVSLLKDPQAIDIYAKRRGVDKIIEIGEKK
ncbi:Histidine--tRNA ligase [Alkaliphilus metalliredigens QYMF]|uniref:ATP phosphoribosyltransferase regulatory subunit n=1 Tax=Alkaliphilus metalliredigens (strain QYMF) TaxID=293826 RepID=HISZ_ALKMQ|nr:ATP phosphoribosyltransferase regulatory subunit [Alkaliphilus metalliredigens]A6TKS9.1 RecName: Full=ATP phosphoribosyltransferase regulatory subunit [Alkaliphilus metalliredigens QYMF]ABR46797.1 Histidine--tRNA ligase [Alkaliphilus metalliredigens QYMF]